MDSAQNEINNSSSPLNDRLIAAWEIISITISFLMAEWLLRPFGSRDKFIHAVPLLIAFGVMILSHRARGETPRSIGFRLDNLWPALRFLFLPTLACLLIIGVIGSRTGGFESSKWREWQWLIWLPLWGLLQQYALQGFLYRRVEILFGKSFRTVLIVAFIFALLHLPNPWFAGATFVAGLLWAFAYQRVPNLIALSLSHSILALALVWALPPSLLSGLRVGLRYFL
jgi:membrane protease YdiL (CAAX protease family)